MSNLVSFALGCILGSSAIIILSKEKLDSKKGFNSIMKEPKKERDLLTDLKESLNIVLNADKGDSLLAKELRKIRKEDAERDAKIAEIEQIKQKIKDGSLITLYEIT